jgi:protein-disulfide isomerase
MCPKRNRSLARYRTFYPFILFAIPLLGAACGGACPCDATAASPQAEQGAGQDGTVATVNGEAITQGELERAAGSELEKAAADCEQRAFEIRKEALDMLIAEKLVAARAESEGLSPRQYLLREIKARIVPPSEELLRQIYDASAEQYGELMPDFEQVRESIEEGVVEQLEQEARLALFESLGRGAEVTVLLRPPPPPPVRVPTDGPSLGDSSALVTIVEFSDYECPFCGRAQATVQRIMQSYPGKIRLVFRDLPLSYHRFAAKAAEAAHCAGDQDRFWEMHRMLYENSDALRDIDLKAYAVELGLDADRFNSCLDSSEKARVVEASLALAAKLGLTGAPSFFINGRPLTGALPFERFKEIIDDELRKAGE